MRLNLSLPLNCIVHHTVDGLVLDLPDASIPSLASQLGDGRRLTIDEVCQRYGKSRPTITKWEHSGLKPIVIGKTKFFTEAELHRFEQAQTLAAGRSSADGIHRRGAEGAETGRAGNHEMHGMHETPAR